MTRHEILNELSTLELLASKKALDGYVANYYREYYNPNNWDYEDYEEELLETAYQLRDTIEDILTDRLNNSALSEG